jgi:hypothetical protein
MDFSTVSAYMPEDKRAAALELLKNRPQKAARPLIVHILTFIGAWLGALFFLVFLGLVFFELNGMPTLGILFIVAAFFMQLVFDEKTGNVFLRQEMIALMFIGKASFIFGVAVSMDADVNLLFLICAVLVGTIYPFFRSALDRLASCFALGVYAFLSISGSFFLWKIMTPMTAVALIFALSIFIFYFRKKDLYPLAYGLAAACAFAAWGAHGQPYLLIMFNLPKLVLVAAAASCGLMHLRDSGGITKKNIYILCSCCALAFIFNIASIMGIAYILLGRNMRDIKIEIMGYAIFAGGLSYLYYSLQTTLLAKSAMLFAGGLIMFAAAYAAGRVKNAK